MKSAAIAAWWSAWKWVALLIVTLLLSLWANGYLVKRVWTAKADCRTGMVDAARIAIENERDRAQAADEQAAGIFADTSKQTAQSVSHAQRNTNAREVQLRSVASVGSCRMPADGLPSVQAAIDEANAAAGD
jgi:hypothetical protein